MSMESVNPATGEVLRKFEEMSPQKVSATIEEVDRAFASWRVTSFGERAKYMRAAGAFLRKKRDEYAFMAETLR